jgi:uncharacterized membrane protein YqjE
MSILAEGISAILRAVERLGATVTLNVENRLASLRDNVRLEVRRAAAAIALAIVAAAFAFAALGFAALAVLAAVWDTHRVLGASLVAAFFALLTIIAVLLVRRCTQSARRP